MNAAKMTLASTVVAAALGLALGLAAAPAMADPPVEGEDHTHGGGAISEAEPPFTVALFGLEVVGKDPAEVSPCLGTPVMNKDTLSADFEQGCKITITAELGGDLMLSLFRVEVKTKGSGTTDLRLYFTTNDLFEIGDIAEVYASDKILIDIVPDPCTPTEEICTLIPVMSMPLTKLQQPGKGDVTQENVEFDAIVYTPAP